MSLTPNYGFNIPTGTDSVNLLTQCYPNFTSLDTILKTIELTGMTTATCTKAGTVFQLVRTNSAINVVRFVATGNYQAGDTFTIDGVSVTATAVDGTSIPSGAFVINQSVIGILNGAVFTVMVPSGASTASDVSYDNTGSGLTASNVQDAIDEVKADIPSIPATYDADDIVYDNTGSGLTAANVQDAIDELASSSGGLTSIDLTNVTITSSGAIDITNLIPAGKLPLSFVVLSGPSSHYAIIWHNVGANTWNLTFKGWADNSPLQSGTVTGKLYCV